MRIPLVQVGWRRIEGGGHSRQMTNHRHNFNDGPKG